MADTCYKNRVSNFKSERNMPMSQVLFHIDVNSAYLSWSALKCLADGSATDLREIPSIIGGDMQQRHGVVLAKSIPAKNTASPQANPS